MSNDPIISVIQNANNNKPKTDDTPSNQHVLIFITASQPPVIPSTPTPDSHTTTHHFPIKAEPTESTEPAPEQPPISKVVNEPLREPIKVGVP